MIFVFGSNEAGIHGAGAARKAYENHGAVWKKGFGHYGNSFAIPTKNFQIRSLPLHMIKRYVDQFKIYAKENPNLEFQVTCIGCGLAGFKHQEIAPMFSGSTDNCKFDTNWYTYLGKNYSYWGSY